jgi:hypothetical protein
MRPSNLGLLLTLIALSGGGRVAAGDPPAIDWNKARQHWAFQPPRAQALPRVADRAWPRQRIDHFILSRLEAAKLKPSPEAARATLLRRVTLDLTGLPPTPGEVEAFAQDPTADAYEKVVDDLLAREAFGERMASLWLTLARYAEDQAHIVGNNTALNYPNAWRYREWVIGAFNADLPYDRFIRKQLAVDLDEPGNREDLPALGFLGLGHKLYSRGRKDVQAEEWSEQVDTVSQTFLGLTVACARCHDHKFDPVTMRDYYAMAGIFASLKMVNLRPDGELEKDGTLAEKMDPGTLHIVRDGEIQDLPIYMRGDVETPGEPAPRGYLQVLSRDEPETFHKGSGRSELAGRIADHANPLTARVLVNRVWGMMFGKPLVRTASNFGGTGEAPTHPELLDDLAVRFVANGWSLKKLIRELALSATYRQSSLTRPEAATRDEANENYWRMERRRMSIEMLRDSLLAAAGTLEREGGLSADPDQPADHRRTVYAKVSRRELNKTLMLFDYPDANVHAEDRSTSTTPTQKLYLMNSPFVLAQAKALAKRLRDLPTRTEADKVIYGYQLMFARDPDADETAAALAFLRETEVGGDAAAWEQLAHALFMTNEMIYVD